MRHVPHARAAVLTVLSAVLGASTAGLAAAQSPSATPPVPTTTTPAVTVPTAPGATTPADPAEPATATADPSAVLSSCAGTYTLVSASGAPRPVGTATLVATGGRAELRFRLPGRKLVVTATPKAVGPDAVAGSFDGDVPDALSGTQLRVESAPCVVSFVRAADAEKGERPLVLFGRGATAQSATDAALADLWEDEGAQRAVVPLLLHDDDPRPAATARLLTDADLRPVLRDGGPAAATSFLRARKTAVWVESASALRDADGSKLASGGTTAAGATLLTGTAWDIALGAPDGDQGRLFQLRVHNSWLIDRILGPLSPSGAPRIADRDASKRSQVADIDLAGGTDGQPEHGLSVDVYAGTGVSAAESASTAGWRRSGPTRTGSDGAIMMAAQRPQTRFSLPLWRSENFAAYYAARGESARLWQNWLQAVWYEPPRDSDGRPFKLQIASRIDNVANTDAGTWRLASAAIPDGAGATVDTLTFDPYGTMNDQAPNNQTALKGIGWPYSPARVPDGSSVAVIRVEPVGNVAPNSLSISVPYPSEPVGPVLGGALGKPLDALTGKVNDVPKGSNPCQRPPTGETVVANDPARAVHAERWSDGPPAKIKAPSSDPFAGSDTQTAPTNVDVGESMFRKRRQARGVEDADSSVGTKVIRMDGESAIACADVRQATTPTACTSVSRLSGALGGDYNDASISDRTGVCRLQESSGGSTGQGPGYHGSTETLCPPGSDAYAEECASTEVTVAVGRLTCPTAYPYNQSYRQKADQYYHLDLSFLQGEASNLVKDGLMGAGAALKNWYDEPSKDKTKADPAIGDTLAANNLRLQRELNARKTADETANVWWRLADPKRLRGDLLKATMPLPAIAEAAPGEEDDEDLFSARGRTPRVPVANAAGLVDQVVGSAASGLVGLAFKSLGLDDVKFRVRWDPEPYQTATDASAYDDLTDRWGLVYQMKNATMNEAGDAPQGAKGTGPTDRGFQDVTVAAWGAAGSAYIMCTSSPDGPPALR